MCTSLVSRLDYTAQVLGEKLGLAVAPLRYHGDGLVVVH